MDIGSPEEEAIRQKWLNEDVAWENHQIEQSMRDGVAPRVEVLMGIGERDGQWLCAPPDEDHHMWHPSRKDALADAAQYAADFGTAVIISADRE